MAVAERLQAQGLLPAGGDIAKENRGLPLLKPTQKTAPSAAWQRGQIRLCVCWAVVRD